MHSFIEDICLELGNFEGFATYTADSSAVFKNNIKLANLASLNSIPKFTYTEILKEIKRIDVVWFNKKGLMSSQKAFEIVDSIGTFSEAFNRTLQLLNFRTDFLIVGPKQHYERFNQKIKLEPYIRFKERYRFNDYDTLIDFYQKALELKKLKTSFCE